MHTVDNVLPVYAGYDKSTLFAGQVFMNLNVDNVLLLRICRLFSKGL